MPRNKKSTDESSKNKNLSDAVKAKIDGSKDEAELNGIIAEATKYHVEMVELREGDGHLKELREQMTEASAATICSTSRLSLPQNEHFIRLAPVAWL